MTEGLDQGGRPVGGALLMEERRLVIVGHVGCHVALHHGNPTTPTMQWEKGGKIRIQPLDECIPLHSACIYSVIK